MNYVLNQSQHGFETFRVGQGKGDQSIRNGNFISQITIKNDFPIVFLIYYWFSYLMSTQLETAGKV